MNDGGDKMTEGVQCDREGKCGAALIIGGAHYWCDQSADHRGAAHSSRHAEAIWCGSDAVDGAVPLLSVPVPS